MKKNKTTSFLIFSVFIVILVVLLLVLFINVIKNKNLHISAVATTLGEKMKEKEDATVNVSKITEIKSIQESINNYFVDPNRIDTFVSYLEGIGSDIGSSVEVNGIDIPQKTKNTIAFKLSIKGTFEEVMKTISFMENIPYQIDITQIYLNENAKPFEEKDTKTDTKVKIVKSPIWQADISFNILSSN
jgi:hypothetical protein